MKKKTTITVSSIIGFPPEGIVRITQPLKRKWYEFWKPKELKEFMDYKLSRKCKKNMILTKGGDN